MIIPSVASIPFSFPPIVMPTPNQNDDFFSGRRSYVLIAMGSAAFVVIIYHLISVCLCKQRITNRNPEQAQRQQQLQHLATVITPPETPSRQHETAVAHLIPAHKYKKKKEATSEDDSCAVCLGEFEDSDELRTLPWCLHSYHVPCIDAWLYSNSSCPICRTLATPSPAVHPPEPEFGSGEANRYHDSGVLQSVVHNRLV